MARVDGEDAVDPEAEVLAGSLGEELLHARAGVDAVEPGDALEDRGHDDERPDDDQHSRHCHLARADQLVGRRGAHRAQSTRRPVSPL
jgi:hypothetical protein